MRIGDPVDAGGDDSSPSVPRPSRAISRGLIFALLCTACVAAAGGYVAWAVVRDGSAERAAVSGPMATSGDEASFTLVAGGPGTLLFQSRSAGEDWARVGLVPLDGTDGAARMLPLRCLRIHFAADRGLCLAEDEGFVTTYDAYVVGPDFQVRHKLSLSGIPSRARVSSDGRYGATTVFVTGHSYSEAGFSTETMLIDLASGARIGTLEEFAVWRDGERFEAIDFNFWGVTFARDSNRFYATLATHGETYLVEGDVGGRQMRVLRENVECPSLSPDGTRLAFKKRVGGEFGAVQWRFHVLDLATMAEIPLAEPRSIDDQIEWLDDGRVLYGVDSNLWTMPADGSGGPRKFLKEAVSPAVVHTASPPPQGAAQAPANMLTLPSTDIAVAISADPAPVHVGEELTYTVTVTNYGPADATNIVIDDFLPTGVAFGAFGQVRPENSSYGCPADSGYFSCTIYHLPSGGSWTISFTVRPTAAGTILNRVTVSATQPDPRPDNDSAATETAVTAGP